MNKSISRIFINIYMMKITHIILSISRIFINTYMMKDKTIFTFSYILCIYPHHNTLIFLFNGTIYDTARPNSMIGEYFPLSSSSNYARQGRRGNTAFPCLCQLICSNRIGSEVLSICHPRGGSPCSCSWCFWAWRSPPET